ncbi:MAG TPA: galactokinase [Jatrophihabitantaceae bacterium]|jgi:galactokinase
MSATTAWRAPGRVNLIGEHTDYNGGFALPLAIQQGCTATVTATSSGELRVSSAQRGETVVVPMSDLRGVAGWAAYPVGVVWALGVQNGGLDIHVDSDVPGGAGLSSSAALICAVATAVNDLLAMGLSRAELVAVTHRTENDYVGAPTGGMDQMAALLCEAGHALLCDMRAWSAQQVPFDPAAAALALLVVDTHARHRHAEGEYAARRASCEKAADLLGVSTLRDITDLDAALTRLPDDELRRRVRHIVTENDRVLRTADLLRAGRIRSIGPLLTASHASMRDDYEITAPEIDTAVEALLEAGALGARMTGGGFGGCVIALVDEGRIRQATNAVQRAYRIRGYTPATAFTARPSQGAHAMR